MATAVARQLASVVRTHPALTITAIYLASRLITWIMLEVTAALATADSRFGSGGTAAKYVVAWDGQWYWTVAAQGYPAVLPLAESGAVAENAWAFMPVYAYLANAIGLPFGHFGVGAFIVSFLSGLGACLALFRLLRNRVSANVALWAVIFFANGPLGALFHVAYAESLFMLLLFLALDCVLRRSWGWLYLLIPIMGFTRPGILPFALMLGLYGIWRFTRRRVDPLPAREVVHIVALGALASAVGFSWQVIAGLVTGDMSAYLQTELSWRQNWIPGSGAEFIPFDGWLLGLNFWFDYFHVPVWAGWVAFAIVLAGSALLVWRARVFRALGVELRLWFASYLLYLLAVFFPQSSTLRLLIPLSPAWGALAGVRSLAVRVAALVGCLAYQGLWIFSVYGRGVTVLQIP